MTLLFDAALVDTSDWTTAETTGGAFAADTVYDKSLGMTGDGSGVCYLEKSFGANKTAVIARVTFESLVDWENTATTDFVTLLTSDNVVVGALQLYLSGSDDTFLARVRQDSGTYLSPYGGSLTVKRRSIYTMWLMWQASSTAGANDGYIGAIVGCNGSSFLLSRVAVDNDTLTAAKIRVGVQAGNMNGTAYIHDVRVWDARPTELDEIHYAAAHGLAYEGLPAVFDLAAPTGGTVTKVEVRTGNSAWADITLAAGNGTRTDAKQTAAVLPDATLFAVADTYLGCLVEATAAPSALLPACQIVSQPEGTAYLSDFAPWLAAQQAAYTTNNNTYVAQTFSAWRVKEVASGVYRVGIPGANISTGDHTVRITIDGVTYQQEFVAVEKPRIHRPLRTRTGECLAVGYDDSLASTFTTHRFIYAARDVRPYNSVICGCVGGPYVPWLAWRKLRDENWTMFCHLWDASNLGDYTQAEGRLMLDRARAVLVLQGCDDGVFVPPNGIDEASGGESMVEDIHSRWAASRNSGGVIHNDQPIATDAKIQSVSVYNDTYEGADAAAEAATAIAAMQAAGGANTLFSVQFHAVGSTSGNSTSLTLQGAILDAATAAGITLVNLAKYLSHAPETDGYLEQTSNGGYVESAAYVAGTHGTPPTTLDYVHVLTLTSASYPACADTSVFGQLRQPVRVVVYAKKSANTMTETPSFSIIDAESEEVLDSVEMTDNTDWQALTLIYDPTYDRNLKVRIQGRNASGTVFYRTIIRTGSSSGQRRNSLLI